MRDPTYAVKANAVLISRGEYVSAKELLISTEIHGATLQRTTMFEVFVN
jgi:hypothetical protein